MIKLAIVIPCFKDKYLKETLNSLVTQSNKNFNVYIGNDAGSLEIDKIILDFKNKLPIIYKRFENNLGKTSLIRHWDRCIALTSEEPWIWVLPDDDYLGNNCVERLLETIEFKQNSDLFRFNTIVIDECSRPFGEANINPNYENGISFIADKLSGNRRSSLAEYIFSRRVFQSKGFVEFPLAWCSDDATWLSFSDENGIQTISDSFVFIRISNESISGRGHEFHEVKLQAGILFLLWLKRHYFGKLNTELISRGTTFNKVTQKWYLLQLLNKGYNYRLLTKIRIIISSIKIWGLLGIEEMKFYYHILIMK